ncbi:MAG: type III-B CRISPR module RAMP protein Cmr4 [Clostridia bacterium]|nr:type III-B CRISPR module RAMP protein Cmr4 [Clostridia bacterium]
MTTKLYYIDCLTNLHVGSGDANFNIVDKEVEKDPITGDPIIHASGIKGALRDAFKKFGNMDKEFEIFGKPASANESNTVGTYKFFDAHILYRPLRAKGGIYPYVNVTTVESVNAFIDIVTAFGINAGVKKISVTFHENINFLTSEQGVQVEGEASQKLDDENINNLKKLFGDNFAIAKSLDDYPLPVIARNNLQGKGNLWYEEYVPHGSRFYMLAIIPDGASADEVNKVIPKMGQVGGNASVGYGYCSFTAQEGKNEQA